MLVTPIPGTVRENLQETLREVHTAALNANNGHYQNAQERLAAYFEWTTDALRRLSGQVSVADLDQLLLTPGYGRLLAALGTVTGVDISTQRVLNGMVQFELQQRVAALELARKAFDERISRWPCGDEFVVADTSLFIEHENKLDDMDFSLFLPEGIRLRTVRLLVPIVVIDELDGLKNRASKNQVRWRAGYTLAVFDRIFANGVGPAMLRAAVPPGSSDRPARSDFLAEIVLDPPGHIRLPINDDELVDRALAIQALAGSRVRLITFDTGQATRARVAGLAVSKLTKTLGDGPEGRSAISSTV